MKSYQFNLQQRVRVRATGATALIDGRARCSGAPNAYWLLPASDGSPAAWYAEDLLDREPEATK